jgi:hypothetical protein
MQALQSFKTLATTHPTTQHHIPEDLILQQHCCEHLKYHIVKFSINKGKKIYILLSKIERGN